jgi:cholesterol oxidase
MSFDQQNFDYDQVVIGSGFGGSCSALRLSEKGYKVLLLEKGKRWKDKDFPASNWNFKKYLWAPKLGLTGPWQMSFTRKVVALHGVGVGGGSLIYANTHYIPDAKIFESEQWTRTKDNWYDTLLPFYGLGQRMLGTSSGRHEGVSDKILKEVAQEMGREDTYELVNTGVYYHDQYMAAENKQEPYFQGEGPSREACNLCARCMMGCPKNAKNTLEKNYLYFAEKNGVEIRSESQVTRIEPLQDSKGQRNGSAGYELTIRSSTGLFAKTYKLKTRGVVLSAGVIGTLNLLMASKYQHQTLANVSDLIGRQVRTNSETFYSVGFDTKSTFTEDEVSKGLAITSAFKPDDITTIEPVRFNKGSDTAWLSFMMVPLTDAGGVPRVLRLLLNMIKQPWTTLKLMNPVGKAKRNNVLMIMQSADSYVHAKWKRAWTKLFRKRLTIEQEQGDQPLTTYFDIGQKVAKQYSQKAKGEVGNVALDILVNTPATAHIMGGVPIGKSAQDGVVDESGEVFGYQGLRVLDGSIIPGNLAVNPSLTILALTEYAMSQIKAKDGRDASDVTSVAFSKPLPGMVSQLDGSGDLLAEAIARSRAKQIAVTPVEALEAD